MASHAFPRRVSVARGDASGGDGPENDSEDASGTAEAVSAEPAGVDPEGEAAVEGPDPRIGRGFFGEDIGPGSAMAHLIPGEIHRTTLWRERLDRTTSWAVIVMAAVLTWAFSSESNPHYVLLVGVAVLGFFLGVEALRYRGYDIWRSRVRTIQVNAFAYLVAGYVAFRPRTWRARGELRVEDLRRE